MGRCRSQGRCRTPIYRSARFSESTRWLQQPNNWQPISTSAPSARPRSCSSRIFFTLGALIVARIGSYIPMPGIDPAALAQFMQQQGGGLLDVFNTLAGGAVGRMAIFALGIMPYISASIIIQLMTTVFPELEALKKEGEAGRKVLNQYTRYCTVALAAVQAYGIAIGLEHVGSGHRGDPSRPVLPHRRGHHPDRRHHAADVDRRADHQPRRRQRHFAHHLRRHRGAFPADHRPDPGSRRAPAPTNPLLVIFFVVFTAGLVGFIVFMERAQRRLFVTYPKRQVGNKVYGGEVSHLPLKLNVSGVIPPIFASSILLLPTTYASFNAQNLPDWLQTIVTYLSRGQPLYLIALCGADPVLHLLLHLHRLQSGRDGGESEEVWRRVSRHPARQEERRSSSTMC